MADIEPAFLAQQVIAASQSLILLAIPLFMPAGVLMTAGGLSQRLVDLASALVRHRTGGPVMVTVLAVLVFYAISGSVPAATAAIGSIMIPNMVAAVYDRAFAAEEPPDGLLRDDHSDHEDDGGRDQLPEHARRGLGGFALMFQPR